MKRTVTHFLFPLLAVVLAASGCAGGPEPDPSGSITQAVKDDPIPGNGADHACPGLMRAHDNVCPDKPSCANNEEQLRVHGCIKVAECPCNPNTWNLYTGFNGVYCFSPAYGRLSVCSTTGQEICVGNLGGSPMTMPDPALCAACRTQFPQTLVDISGTGTHTVNACSDLPFSP